jgi:outer membrane protein OmpA-like peptidoglycan-associated protein
MKKNRNTIAALILAGATGLFAFSANADKSIKKTNKTGHYPASMSSSALAAMKLKNVEFGFDKQGVPTPCTVELDKVAKLMIDNNASLKVSGYADNVGEYVYNWKLSEKRAKAVKDYLVSKGCDSTRIATTEFGETHPVASNKTSEGRKKNRRAEMNFAE